MLPVVFLPVLTSTGKCTLHSFVHYASNNCLPKNDAGAGSAVWRKHNDAGDVSATCQHQNLQQYSLVPGC